MTTGGRGCSASAASSVVSSARSISEIADANDVVAEFRHQQFGGVLIDRLRHRDGHAHLEQRLDEVGTLFRHAVGEFLHRDRLGHLHVADLLDLRLARAAKAALFLFTRTLQRGEAARTRPIVAQRPGDGQLARLATIVALAVARRRRTCRFVATRRRLSGARRRGTRSPATGGGARRRGRGGSRGGGRFGLGLRLGDFRTLHRGEATRCRPTGVGGQNDRLRRRGRGRPRSGTCWRWRRCRNGLRLDRCGRRRRGRRFRDRCRDGRRRRGRFRRGHGFGRRRRRRLDRGRLGRRSRFGGRGRLGRDAGLFLRTGALCLDRFTRDAFVAAAMLLGRVHAGLFGLAQQLGLQFEARQAGIAAGCRPRRGGRRRGRGGTLRRGGRFGGSRFDGLLLFAGTAEHTAALHLHDHRIGAAMAEALLHLAGFHGALEAERRAGAQLRLVVVDVTHPVTQVPASIGRGQCARHRQCRKIAPSMRPAKVFRKPQR